MSGATVIWLIFVVYTNRGTIVLDCNRDKQKAGLQCCCSATQGSGIALNSEQTTLSPRRMYIYTRTGVQKYIHRASRVTLLWLSLWIYQIPVCQNKARKTLFVNMSFCFTSVSDERYKTFAAAKVRKNFDICKFLRNFSKKYPEYNFWKWTKVGRDQNGIS